jgi:hypothetical protein
MNDRVRVKLDHLETGSELLLIQTFFGWQVEQRLVKLMRILVSSIARKFLGLHDGLREAFLLKL